MDNYFFLRTQISFSSSLPQKIFLKNLQSKERSKKVMEGKAKH